MLDWGPGMGIAGSVWAPLAELPICVFSGGHRVVLCAAGPTSMLPAWATCGELSVCS